MSDKPIGRCAFIFLFAAQLCIGQTRSGIQIPDLNLLRPDLKADGISQQTGKNPIPMDSPVNPEEYLVGPGDVLSINIWSSSPKEHVLTITPEASLLIPSVGALDVKGLTLTKVKERISGRISHFYSNSEITITLLSPRKVVVRITGNVVNEGTYEMYSVQRVSQLIAQANLPRTGQATSKQFEEDLRVAIKGSSDRSIVLKRRDGGTHRVDLVKYEFTGDGKLDPYLSEGDVVFIPERQPIAKSIGVFGGVVRSWTFEYAEGDSLTHLVQMAFGLKPRADTLHAYLTRLSFTGTSMETLSVNLKSLLDGSSPDVALRPGDRLVITGGQRDDRQNYIAVVEGEVNQPGQYPITKNSTRLSDVIRAAGGFTPEAFLKGATVVRARVSQQATPEEVEDEQLRSARSSLDLQDSSYYLVETALRMKGEGVAVDFEELFVRGDSAHDVILRPYDTIKIPRKTNTIYVFGQVLSPGHISYVEGKNVSYYIDKAGGVTNDARGSDTKVIKGSTRTWLAPGETTLEDGDFIWVPREVHYPFSHYISIYAQVAAIVGTIATVALLINSLK